MAAHRSALTLVEVLIVVIILGILAAAVVPQLTAAADEGRAGSAALVVRAVMRIVEARKDRDGALPASITPEMFEPARLPGNPLFPHVADPKFSASADARRTHPAVKTSSTDIVWWYNSGNGIVRALVPDTGSDAEKIARYNAANAVHITSLDQMGDEALALEPMTRPAGR